MEEDVVGEGVGPAPAPGPGVVVRTPAGWEASFGDQLVVGVYATQELGVKALDLLRLKTGLDAGQAADAVALQLPLGVSRAAATPIHPQRSRFLT